MEIKFSTHAPDNRDIDVMPVFEGLNVNLGAFLQAFRAREALIIDRGFTAKRGETLTLPLREGKTIALGMGVALCAPPQDAASVRDLAAPLYRAALDAGARRVCIDVPFLAAPENPAFAAQLADALLQESYAFTKYKTGGDSPRLEGIVLLTPDPAAAKKAFARLAPVTNSVFWASDLVNEPGNVLNPATYAKRLGDELKPLGVRVKVLTDAQMESLGMNLVRAVGSGSRTKPRTVLLEYDGTNGRQARPVALVGKGITFDAGGLNLKTSGMEEMTMDMDGSAAVAGAMRALAARGARVHAAAILPLAENMPDGNAVRPGDILTAMNGKTVYIKDTDCEGRLILADALAFAQQAYKPHTIIDAATLTGSVLSTLGLGIAGVFANDDGLWKAFERAADKTGEDVWRLPLRDSFTKAVRKGPHADLVNYSGRWGDAGNAAAFLREFIGKKKDGADTVAWAHIDMAGPGMPETVLKGWGVRLLHEVVASAFEEKPGEKKSPRRVTSGPRS